MEYNFDFLSSCRIFVGKHLVAEVVLAFHVKNVIPEIAEVSEGGGIHPTLSLLTILLYFAIKDGVTIAV